MRLRSVEFEMPQAAAAAEFFTQTWGLIDAGTRGATHYMRGTEDHAYVISATEAPTKAVVSVTFSGSEQEVAGVFAEVNKRKIACLPMRSFDEPGAPRGFTFAGEEGQVYRVLSDTEPVEALAHDRNHPLQLTHAVMNVLDRTACERFAEGVLGFKLSDRTRAMSFLRCNRQHHAVAYVGAEDRSLNHLAFEMMDMEAVMQGIGRMRDHKVPLLWGPGRHGPGNNVFSYFVPPHGGVIEYTSEINQVDDNYPVGSPEDWKWPPGRFDHWGISMPNGALGKEAESVYKFRQMQ